MNTPRLIWGIICLALAALLAVLNIVLPPEDLVFMIGDANFPWIPPLVLAVVGVVLLATAQGRGGAMAAAPATQAEPTQDPAKVALNQRMEAIAWGCFLIMAGGFMLVPEAIVAKGFWSIGVGLIMLGLNAARYVNQIRMSGFTTVLGIIALVGGFLERLGMEGIEGALLLMILGAYLILKPWFDKQQLFGKAEESRG